MLEYTQSSQDSKHFKAGALRFQSAPAPEIFDGSKKMLELGAGAEPHLYFVGARVRSMTANKVFQKGYCGALDTHSIENFVNQ